MQNCIYQSVVDTMIFSLSVCWWGREQFDISLVETGTYTQQTGVSYETPDICNKIERRLMLQFVEIMAENNKHRRCRWVLILMGPPTCLSLL